MKNLVLVVLGILIGLTTAALGRVMHPHSHPRPESNTSLFQAYTGLVELGVRATISPDAKLVAYQRDSGLELGRVTDEGDTARVMRIPNELLHLSRPQEHGWVKQDQIAFTSDGRLLITAGQDARLRIWDLSSIYGLSGNTEAWDQARLKPQLVRTIPFPLTASELGERSPVRGLALASDDKALAILAPDNLVICSDIQAKSPTWRQLSQRGWGDGSYWRTAVWFVPGSHRLIGFDSSSSFVTLADEQGNVLETVRDDRSVQEGYFQNLVLSPNGKEAAIILDGSVLLWNLETHEQRWINSGEFGGNDFYFPATFTPDSGTLAVGDADGTEVRFHSADKANGIWPSQNVSDVPLALRYTPDAGKLVIAGQTGVTVIGPHR